MAGEIGAGRSKIHPSQSTKTMLKEDFGQIHPTHLDLSHVTTSLNSDQLIQFAQAVGLDAA